MEGKLADAFLGEKLLPITHFYYLLKNHVICCAFCRGRYSKTGSGRLLCYLPLIQQKTSCLSFQLFLSHTVAIGSFSLITHYCIYILHKATYKSHVVNPLTFFCSCFEVAGLSSPIRVTTDCFLE